MGTHVTHSGHLPVLCPNETNLLAVGPRDGYRNVLREVVQSRHLFKLVRRKCLSHNVLSRLDLIVR